MKKIIVAILVIASFTAKSQVVDTTVTSIAACKIVPFKARFSDTSNVTHLGVRIISDDLKSRCDLYYCLMDKWQNIIMQGNQAITGNDYLLWDGNSKYPFVYLGTVFNLIFKP